MARHRSSGHIEGPTFLAPIQYLETLDRDAVPGNRVISSNLIAPPSGGDPRRRLEISEIGGLFSPEPVDTCLGNDATEERAKALGKDVDIVHFAVHGVLDPLTPHDSSSHSPSRRTRATNATTASSTRHGRSSSASASTPISSCCPVASSLCSRTFAGWQRQDLALWGRFATTSR